MMLLIFGLFAYLMGSISFAVISSWLFKLPDPRTYGSKNPGATNVLRSGKKSAAIVTLLGDAGKGWLAAVSYTHLRAHETVLDPVCRLLLEKKKKY